MISNKQCTDEQKLELSITEIYISEASDVSDSGNEERETLPNSEDEEREVVLTEKTTSERVNLGTNTKSTVASWLDGRLSEASNDKDEIQKWIDMIPDKTVRGIMQRKHKAMILSKSSSIKN